MTLSLRRGRRQAGSDLENLSARVHDPFGQSEPGSEFAIVAGVRMTTATLRAFHPNLERFLGRDFIGSVSAGVASSRYLTTVVSACGVARISS